MPENYRLSPVAKVTCQNCPLHSSRHVYKQVTTEVHPKENHTGDGMGVDVMFIAEAPGRHENEVGRPVIGATGIILRQLVCKIQGDETGVAYGNTVRCRPADETNPVKDRPPTFAEVACCKTNILRDIEKIKPKHIVLLGASAAVGLALDRHTKKPIDPATKIFTIRGREFVIRTADGQEYPATAALHFGYIARNPSCGGIFEDDITRAFLKARGNVYDQHGRGKPTILVDKIDRVEKLLAHMVRNMKPHQVVALDYETTGLLRIGNKILTIGFAYDEDQGYVIPYQHQDSPWTFDEFQQVRKLMIKFFKVRKPSFRSLIAHNLKFECAVTLDSFGAYLWDLPIECTMLRTHALNENRSKETTMDNEPFSLKTLVDDQLGFTGYKDQDMKDVLVHRKKGELASANFEELVEYNGMDCYVEVRLFNQQEVIAKALKYDKQLKQLGLNLLGPVSMFAAIMERNGIKADKEHLRYLLRDDSPIAGRMQQIEKELRAMPTVQKCNELMLNTFKKSKGLKGIWGSQLAPPWVWGINKQDARKILFADILGLTPQLSKKTKKPSFNKAFWKANTGVKEVDLTSEWVALEKLHGTYVVGPYKMLQTDPDLRDGRIRASINFHRTVTGRTSSSEPNMQNIPKGKTAVALSVKKVYTVEPGNLMVCADYSQAEVRWLAEITKDPLLREAFNKVEAVQKAYVNDPTEVNRIRMAQEGDFHRQTASQIFKKPPEKITDMERGAAKSVVFGIIYGQTEWGVADAMKISVKEAVNYREMFMNQFPRARKWLDYIEKKGFQDGFVESPLGRRRHLVSGFLITRDNEFFETPDGRRFGTDIGKFRQYEDRICRNSPIQSVASDTNMMACIKIQQYILEHDKPWKLLNTVHDSIIAEIPIPDIPEYVDTANRIMVDPDLMQDFGVKMKIPFVSDFSIGPNWGDQVDVLVTRNYTVTCKECGKKREEHERPKNQRCEECGSKSIELGLKSGPLDLVLRYWKHKLKQN